MLLILSILALPIVLVVAAIPVVIILVIWALALVPAILDFIVSLIRICFCPYKCKKRLVTVVTTERISIYR